MKCRDRRYKNRNNITLVEEMFTRGETIQKELHVQERYGTQINIYEQLVLDMTNIKQMHKQKWGTVTV